MIILAAVLLLTLVLRPGFILAAVLIIAVLAADGEDDPAPVCAAGVECPER